MSASDDLAYLRVDLPHLSLQARKTSEATRRYNCLAWAAASDTTRWWERILSNFLISGYYWPSSVREGGTIVGWIRVLESEGFATCHSREYEPGFVKVAVYVKGAEPKHIARQIGPASWTSKLGDFEDIEHPTLEELEGEEYGKVGPVLRKPVPVLQG
jgi:hypothetical protein